MQQNNVKTKAEDRRVVSQCNGRSRNRFVKRWHFVYGVVETAGFIRIFSMRGLLSSDALHAAWTFPLFLKAAFRYKILNREPSSEKFRLSILIECNRDGEGPMRNEKAIHLTDIGISASEACSYHEILECVGATAHCSLEIRSRENGQSQPRTASLSVRDDFLWTIEMDRVWHLVLQLIDYAAGAT